uniref:Uncharacterized protein n=1 Tax=Rhizophora mucronata TaxID=61149 RepID=A0A2P2PZ72_RHIMU
MFTLHLLCIAQISKHFPFFTLFLRLVEPIFLKLLC